MLIKIIITLLEVTPKWQPLASTMFTKRIIIKLEWKSMDSKKGLSGGEGSNAQRVNLINIVIGHRIAANRHAITVHHQCATCAAVIAIVAVGVT